jgi:rhodanese-related sulfurtransferase
LQERRPWFGRRRKLGKAGFADVVNLEGGVAAWQKAGLPLAK